VALPLGWHAEGESCSTPEVPVEDGAVGIRDTQFAHVSMRDSHGRSGWTFRPAAASARYRPKGSAMKELAEGNSDAVGPGSVFRAMRFRCGHDDIGHGVGALADAHASTWRRAPIPSSRGGEAMVGGVEEHLRAEQARLMRRLPTTLVPADEERRSSA